MTLRMKALFFLGFFLTLTSCASKEKDPSFAEYDENSKAAGAAYLVDAMQVRKAMPLRPNWRRWEFYYKHCSQIGEGVFYSKTSYECAEPY